MSVLTNVQEGKAVYSSGVDQKIAQFSYIKVSHSNKEETSSGHRWVQTSNRRLHSHDVRALATWPPYAPLPPKFLQRFVPELPPIVVSGGLDMSVVLTPAGRPAATAERSVNPLVTSSDTTFEDSYHRRLAYKSGPSTSSVVRSAASARLVICMRDAGISLWKINARPRTSPIDLNTTHNDWEKALELDLNVRTNLIASDISDDGHWLVTSDLYETKLFHLENDVSRCFINWWILL